MSQIRIIMQNDNTAKSWSESQETIRRLLMELGWTDDVNLSDWAARFSYEYKKFRRISKDLIDHRIGLRVLWEAGFDKYVEAIYMDVEHLVDAYFMGDAPATLESFWKAADKTLQRLNETDRFYLV